MEKPEVHLLGEIEWQFFLTLTFEQTALRERSMNNARAERVRNCLFFALMRTVSKWGRIHFHQLLWVRRSEFGETSDLLHLHSLVSGLPDNTVNVGFCFAMANQWRKLGGGHAQCYLYDPSRNGLDYVFKGSQASLGVDADGRDWRLASQYETRKFGCPGSDVMFSDSVVRLIAQRRRVRRAQIGKYGTLRTAKR